MANKKKTKQNRKKNKINKNNIALAQDMSSEEDHKKTIKEEESEASENAEPKEESIEEAESKPQMEPDTKPEPPESSSEPASAPATTKKPGKIKSSLFSADGKLVSAFHNNSDGYVPLSEPKPAASETTTDAPAAPETAPTPTPTPTPPPVVKPTSEPNPKSKKPGKIKSSLFSSDGKLVSSFHNTSDYVPAPAPKPAPQSLATTAKPPVEKKEQEEETMTEPESNHNDDDDDDDSTEEQQERPAATAGGSVQVYEPVVDDFLKNKKPGKIKTMLFSSDGKLLPPGSGGNAEDTNQQPATTIPVKTAMKTGKQKAKETEKNDEIKETVPVPHTSPLTTAAGKARRSVQFVEGTKDEENRLGSNDGAFPTLDFKPFPSLDDEYDDILDGQPNVDIKEEQLSWSRDDNVLSDWRIIVQDSRDGSDMSVYYVHKLMLSTGPTKSEYFDSICKSHNPGENVTKLTLSSSAVAAFPTMLDFMYSREDTLDVNTNNAVALRHLGRILSIRKLVVLVTTFIRDDMAYAKSLHYLNAGAEFDDQKVMTTAAQTCAVHILEVNREGLTNLVPPLFSRVVAAGEIACTSFELSQIVGEFCRKNEDVMDVKLLQHVTKSSIMPEVSPTEAVYLLNLAEKHEGRMDYDKNDTSGLQARCIKASSTSWNKTVVGQELVPLETELEVEKTFSNKAYTEISPELKVVLLERSLLVAHGDFNELDTTWEDNSKNEIESKEQQVQSKDGQIRELERAKAYLETEVISLKTELSRFKRMSLTHEMPPKLKNCTYSPPTAASTSPSRKRDQKSFGGDKQSKKYGTDKPSSMPSFVTGREANKAGYVLKEGSAVWPVYYYKNY
eukprot:CAMPEP_0202447888 /NCGR_PEP_ID=MMETSP1360-20130828/6652_1 /ASSEMBLY_ACC=CAM_ASM_000848 /TAXON_ID=515479 /ORGANISM="Licmophora paradoxa, Strain CCMP2313" /LENGTH=842 /DNA_ID=CAMNT_0049065185 /DNA_START=141 /DNA_END=2669 /DNA_ORIENTATION=-